MNKKKKSPFLAGLSISLFFLAIMWAVKLYEVITGTPLYEYGLKPRDISHLYGIITMPFLHGNIDGDWVTHILGNSSAFIVLNTLLYWNYKKNYWPVFLIVWLLGGFWTWIIGADNYHIGASGLVYGEASFLFFAGIFSKNFRLMALSALVIFLYGSMIWGIFPIQPQMSWEAHLCGGLAGLFAAYAYRKSYPRRKRYDWEDEEDEEDNDHYEEPPHDQDYLINYYYRTNEKKGE